MLKKMKYFHFIAIWFDYIAKWLYLCIINQSDGKFNAFG